MHTQTVSRPLNGFFEMSRSRIAGIKQLKVMNEEGESSGELIGASMTQKADE